MFKFFNKLEEILGVPRPLVLVLNYHGVAINSFVEQINYIEEIGYKFITASDVALYVRGEKKINEPSVCLTFDSKHEVSNFAKSFLASRNIPATVFCLAHTKVDLPENWELGCHSKTHKELDNRLVHYKKEIIEAKSILENLNDREIKVFSYPNGKYDKYALRNVQKAGYLGAFTSNSGHVKIKSNPLLINRISVKKNHSLTQFQAFFRHWVNIYWIIFRYVELDNRLNPHLPQFELQNN